MGVDWEFVPTELLDGVPAEYLTTPVGRQWKLAKELRPGYIVIFKMGDFYELFGNDADRAAEVLGLTTFRQKVSAKCSKTMTRAGFPYHEIDKFLRALVEAGVGVTVAHQEEPE